MVRLVLSGREGSFCSRSWDTWIAQVVGTRVKRETTSNNTRVSISLRQVSVSVTVSVNNPLRKAAV